MGFYRDKLEEFKTYVANRNPEKFFLMSSINAREMQAVYTRLDNIQEFISWLEMKADEEESDEGVGGLFTSIGGG